MDTAAYLEALWPNGLPKGQHALIWTLQNRASYWPGTLPAAAKEIARRAANADVYLGVGVGRKPTARAKEEGKKLCDVRLREEEIETWPAFVADLDVAGPGHKAKQGLFTSTDEALEFAEGLRHRPSLIVHSGGGVQLYWALKEPWELSNDDERARAKSYSYGWYRYLLEQAQEIGRTVDPVWDLPRILRPPGTWNRKEGLERPVTGEDTGLRYNEGEFEVFAGEPPAQAIKAGSLVLDPGATAPAHRLELLLDAHPKLKETWLKKRDTELPTSSEYELSIATMLWGCGWSEQEICNAVIHWRRRHGLEEMLRAKRFQATIGKAQASKYACEMRESLEVDTEIQQATEDERKPEVDRDRILKQIKARLGIPVVAIHRVEEAYTIHLPSGRTFAISGHSSFMDQNQWRVVAGLNKLALPAIPNNAKGGHEWYRVLQLLFEICEERTTEDATQLGAVEAALAEGESRASDLSSLREHEQALALTRLSPSETCILLNGELGCSLRELHGRILQDRGIRITRPELAQLLAQAGLEPRQWGVRSGEKTVNRRLWWRAKKT